MGLLIDLDKRQTIKRLGAGLGLAGLTNMAFGAGSCTASDQKPRLPFLAPTHVNTVEVPTADCIDVHAHFFNASDVTIKGYLKGPVAHSMEGLGWLVRLLAPIADAMGEIAISAKDEYAHLLKFEAQFREMDLGGALKELSNFKIDERHRISAEFYKLTLTKDGQEFRNAYEKVMLDATPGPGLLSRPRIRTIDENAVFDAMNEGEEMRTDAVLQGFEATDRGHYAEGILAFIGYMLSSRWANLDSYRQAFTEKPQTIGVRHVLGALVNFDRWLEGSVRSPHEDQLRVHAKISQLSNGYMLPIMSYNPWTDIAENNRALELLREAHCQKFVGAKIYPPNGYLPYGNAAGSTLPGRPTGAQLDKVLEVFWLECQAMNFPVMSHSGPSMGGDDAQDVLSAPDQWRKLLRAGFWPDARGPKLNLGHFGGSRDHKRSHDGVDWPRQFATLMTEPRGENAYADLGYWEDLQCTREDADCKKARQRLKDALAVTVNGVAPAADRVMFGSDWLMLSKEKNWSAYSRQLFKNIQGIAPTTVRRIFETNAKKCFAPWV